VNFFKNIFSGKKKENLSEALYPSKKNFISKIKSWFSKSDSLFEEWTEELEDLLLQYDLGVDTTFYILDELQKSVKENKIVEREKVYELLQKLLLAILEKANSTEYDYSLTQYSPFIVLIVGVNGVGKTTSIGKLAHMYQLQSKKVMLAAADTFRAAAIEQLEIWSQRTQAVLVKREFGSDPASVAYDAIKSALAKKMDIVLIDTAGRLHNKIPLMHELTKIYNVVKKSVPEAPHEVWMILDSTTGQNGIEQAKKFLEYSKITGLIVTKLDGTSKGGVLFSIAHQLKIPIRFIGVGEKQNDLIPFEAKEFIQELFEEKVEEKTKV